MGFIQSISSSRKRGRISVTKLSAIQPPLLVLDSMTLYSSPRRPPGSSSENNLCRSNPSQMLARTLSNRESPHGPFHTRHQQWMTFQESKEETQSNEHTKRNRSPPFARRQPVRLLQTIVPQRRRSHRGHDSRRYQRTRHRSLSRAARGRQRQHEVRTRSSEEGRSRHPRRRRDRRGARRHHLLQHHRHRPLLQSARIRRSRLLDRGASGGDVPLSSRAVGHRSIHTLHPVLLSPQNVR